MNPVSISLSKMMDERIGHYQRTRRKFACLVYVVTIIWLFLALAQWLLVSLVEPVGKIFFDNEWISVIFFALSIALTVIFIFFEQSRYVTCLSWIITFLIVEFATIGLFALVVRTLWPDLIMWFLVCFMLVFLFILLGVLIPHDLTLEIVILFVISFVLLIASVFLLMLYVLTDIAYSFILYMNLVSIIVLMFVMYHAQTISGGRFAEMRADDYLLGTVILFYDFIVIFLLTFYLMINYKFASKEFMKKQVRSLIWIKG